MFENNKQMSMFEYIGGDKTNHLWTSPAKNLMPGRSESQINIIHFHEISKAGKNLERARLPWKPLENNV